MLAPFLHISGDARSIQMGTTSCIFHITGQDTADQVGMFELMLEPGARGAGLYLHRHLTELFYVAVGEIALTLDSQEVRATAGTTMFVPPGTPHGFANRSDQPARLLLVFWPPAGREQFFEGLLAMAQQNPPSQDEVLAFMEQFDQYPIAPSS